ncbi:MAG: molybdenum cofactor biosynthesis protein MoaE [Actinomycetaceae bacterium]|nr:molybdenum cofactor biosynthesis protein MoaE [Actinomycetaceae bacterium]
MLNISFAVQESPIDVAHFLDATEDEFYGATSMFVGKVRNHDPQAGSEEVRGIEYTAHPNASGVLEKEIGKLVREALKDEDKATVTVVHRVGKLDVGDIALLVIVATAHRHPGMDLVGQIVEKVKKVLPVWKKQNLTNGDAKWSNLP